MKTVKDWKSCQLGWQDNLELSGQTGLTALRVVRRGRTVFQGTHTELVESSVWLEHGEKIEKDLNQQVFAVWAQLPGRKSEVPALIGWEKTDWYQKFKVLVLVNDTVLEAVCQEVA
jgi:hypothetical protein